jgi:glyoxylase-like metal-dependent hydrolase (beta-lactamase superfamily II)
MGKNTSLVVGEVTLHWLSGGDFRLDGGTLFATVPKALWQAVVPVAVDNTVCLSNDPLLIECRDGLVLVDTGLGEHCPQGYVSTAPWALLQGLQALGIKREDILHVVITHGDFDHAGGLTMATTGGGRQTTFPGAVHHLQRAEWEEIHAPHRRSAEAYDAASLALLPAGKLHLVDGEEVICPGITVRLSGGHTRGHQVVEIRSGKHLALHLGDLMPTHNHVNPLWHLAYDNYPLTVIDRKIEYLERDGQEEPWFLFYHDPLVRACRLDRQGTVKETWPDPLAKGT